MRIGARYATLAGIDIPHRSFTRIKPEDTHMKSISIWSLVLAIAATSGCRDQSTDVSHSSVMQHITLQDNRVGANSADGRTAWIAADGTLEVDGAQVALEAGQQALAKKYYEQTIELRDQGISVGKNGAKLAGKAIGSVLEGLSKGNPDEIGPKVEAEASAMEVQVSRLCDQIGELQTTQDALAAALPVFRPYATIEDATAADCRSR
jgi:hypothetical protein